MQRAYQLILICLAIFSYQCGLAQSVFQKDTIRIDTAVLYTKHDGDFVAVSAHSNLLEPDNATSNLPVLDNAYIDEVILDQTCQKVFPFSRYKALSKEDNMFVDFHFNNDGNVTGLNFRLHNNTVVLPQDLLNLEQLLKHYIHITLPPSLKANKLAKLLRYNIRFVLLYKTVPVSEKLDSLYTDWIDKDKALFASLRKIDKNKPEDIERFFTQSKRLSSIDSLGFGWTHYLGGNGGGYISISADFYYYKGKVVTYILSSRLPRRPDLNEMYKKLYAELLPLDSGLSCYYKYHENQISKPLKEFYSTGLNKHISSVLLQYMSPVSGILYGYAGGISVTELQNRAMFNKAKAALTNEEVVTLMYAINPASRLTAIEYYFRNKSRFKNQADIENWIQKVYDSTFEVDTINGCIISRERPQKVVEGYLTWKVD